MWEYVNNIFIFFLKLRLIRLTIFRIESNLGVKDIPGNDEEEAMAEASVSTVGCSASSPEVPGSNDYTTRERGFGSIFSNLLQIILI